MFVFTKKHWLFLIIGLTSSLYVLVGRKLYTIQIKKDTDAKGSATKVTWVLPANRGGIYARNGRSHPLAISAPCWKLFIDPLMIPTTVTIDENTQAKITHTNRMEVFRELTAITKFDQDRLFSCTMRKKGRYFPLGVTSEQSIIDAIATNALLKDCIGKEKVTRRIYPQGSNLCHIVGLANSAGQALDGIELTMNKYLTETNGYIEGIGDVHRREIASKRIQKVNPVDGHDVFLTIDNHIQYYVEQAIDTAMVKTKAQSAWIVVQDPRTGAILAMASRPNFSPAEYGSVHNQARWNRPIFMNYEPGSTMKALAFAAGINEGLIHTNSLLNVDNVFYAGRPLSDHGMSGDITATHAIRKSSNRGTSRVAEALGKKRMETYLKAFGFGEKTGIDLPGEGKGILSPYTSWSNLQGIRIAIGQGIAVTGLQMASMYSTIANGGVRMKPYIIDRVVAANGDIILQNKPTAIGTPITSKTAHDITFMLETVTERGGTGWRSKIPGYRVAGKTGTAQIAIPGGYSQTDYTGSFVGFFPSRNPRVTILVALDNPKPNYHGGTVAAPVFSEIGKAITRYLEIPPDFPREIEEILQ